ncbi:MAG TPA: hypothetical protein VIM98_07745 [Dyella sp.]|uniref:hypothetical protein n=1 Tax=Dyella sp. TaxID=1869338 RepID=UPI002F92920C
MRIKQSGEKELAKYTPKGASSGSTGSASSTNNVTPYLNMPMKTGLDGRKYTAPKVRSSINNAIESTQQTFKDLSSSNMPPVGLNMLPKAQANGGMARVTTRGPSDNFTSGEDVTVTVNTGRQHGVRTPSDTPRPRSPKPEDSGTALNPEQRSENAHQNPFQYTGLPGNTVNVPTQANQVVDTRMERHMSTPNSVLVRVDTFTHSTLYAARMMPTGQVQTMHAMYQRRQSASSSSSSSTTTATTTSTPSSTTPSSSSSTAPTFPTLPASGSNKGPGKGGKTGGGGSS